MAIPLLLMAMVIASHKYESFYENMKLNLNWQPQGRRRCVSVAIFCLTLAALGLLAGGTAFYFLRNNDDPPTTSAQNVTNVYGTPFASDKGLGEKLGDYFSCKSCDKINTIY